MRLKIFMLIESLHGLCFVQRVWNSAPDWS